MSQTTWVFIDSSINRGTRIGWLGASAPRLRSVAGRSHAILPALVRLMAKTSPKDIAGICVVFGPGSFTSIRSGVLVANILSRVWNKPLVGVTVEEAKDLVALSARLAKDGKRLAAKTVLPTYDMEPNITVPKIA